MDLMKVVSISVAGGFGGMAGIVSGYPLDTLRIRQQQHCNSGSAFAILRQIVATQCPGGLYRGMGASLASVTFQGIYDGPVAVEDCDLILFGPKRVLMLTAGGLAGVASWVCCYPVDFLKRRLQAQTPSSALKYTMEF